MYLLRQFIYYSFTKYYCLTENVNYFYINWKCFRTVNLCQFEIYSTQNIFNRNLCEKKG